MQSFQFVRHIFRFEAPVLFGEVTHDVFLRWLSWELAVVALIFIYLCQAHMSALFWVKKQTSMQDTANRISVAVIYLFFFKWKRRVRKHTGALTF